MRTMSSHRVGFSLVELLVVIAILVLLATVSLPAFNSITRGSNLQRAGQMIGDQFALARQEAVARNRDVIVQFYETTDSMGRCEISRLRAS
jgi:prepilin-type N-terminal cleavage/methylation domain-containing protein